MYDIKLFFFQSAWYQVKKSETYGSNCDCCGQAPSHHHRNTHSCLHCPCSFLHIHHCSPRIHLYLKQCKTAIYLMPCSTLLPYQNTLTDLLMRCPIALYPSTFDRPSPPSPATQQASRAHDKRDLYNICIVSQLSRNKYY